MMIVIIIYLFKSYQKLDFEKQTPDMAFLVKVAQ